MSSRIGHGLLDGAGKFSLQTVVSNGGFGTIDSLGQHLSPDGVPLLRVGEREAGEKE